MTTKLFPTCMTVFLLWTMKEDILKNVGNRRVLVLILCFLAIQWRPMGTEAVW